jgi:hypothetical protein
VIERLGRLHRDEGGTVLLIVALIMTVLLMLAGLVIDLGAMRGFRAGQQTISDAAAAAGAVTLAETGDGRAACDAAKAYAVTNSASISSLAGIDCTTFPMTCDNATPEVTATTVEDGITVSITFPVADDSPLLESGILGALDQPVSAQDGRQCERISVAVGSTFPTTFSRIAGVESIDIDVHTVAMATQSYADAVAINLLVLDRTGCQTIHSSGNGGIFVDAIYDPGENVLETALAASDSDGSDGCAGTDGVIDLDGSSSFLRADGPTGCENQTGSHLVDGLVAGEGCGKIKTLAPGTPGCNYPACTFGGSNPPNPEPTELRGRLTRAPVDSRYNCKPDYSVIAGSLDWATEALTAANGQDIPGCTDTAAPHVDGLIEAVGETGTPAGFQRWTDAGYPCTVEGPLGTTILVPAGDWHIDCPAFVNKRAVVFQGGNLVFDGPVDVTSQATLAVNAVPGTYAAAGNETWVFIRSGRFGKAGDAELIFNNTFLYASENAHIEMAGGDGALYWVAPDQGDFDDLALWGDSATTHLWAGQADLTLEGAFFTPFAQAEYAGTGGQNQTKAQFIAYRLHARGQGTLIVSPEVGRAVEFPRRESSLIR